MKPVEWQVVDGIPVLKVWELNPHDEFPEISILKLTNEEYQKFAKHPKGFVEFVNKHKIFSKPVIVAGPWVTLSSVEEEPETHGWILTGVHGKLSTLIISALPQLHKKM
ncbi:MAG: hypothetical protein JOZ80_09620 [Acidobacteriaceae bacterium]|nr:hypothetical protein [Acidobacteriaceae bacterium]